MVPVLLIIKQPDYGTAIAFIMALIFMLFVAGIDKKYIIIAIAVVIVAVPLLYFFILPEHAKNKNRCIFKIQIWIQGGQGTILYNQNLQ